MEDREIIERKYLNEMAKYEQCRYRCKVLGKKGRRLYDQHDHKELKERRAQRKIISQFPREYRLRKL